MVVARVKEPRSVKEAMNLPERQKSIDAMKAELNALVENGTWEVVDEPKKGTNIVDSKCFLGSSLMPMVTLSTLKQDLLLDGLSRRTALISRRHLHRSSK